MVTRNRRILNPRNQWMSITQGSHEKQHDLKSQKQMGEYNPQQEPYTQILVFGKMGKHWQLKVEKCPSACRSKILNNKTSGAVIKDVL